MRTLFITLICVFFATLVQAQSSYRIKAGDTLQIEVLEDPSLNRQALVLPGGTIDFPFAGTIRAAGRSVQQVQQAITSGIASNFAAAPNVFVSVDSLRPVIPSTGPRVKPDPVTIKIYFLGEVNSPGIREVEPGTNFLQALAQNGGFTQFAATKRVQVRRTSSSGVQQAFVINYRSIANGGSLENNLILQEGDVIVVPERRLFE